MTWYLDRKPLYINVDFMYTKYFIYLLTTVFPLDQVDPTVKARAGKLHDVNETA